MTYRALLLDAARRLRSAGVPDPETDAALLLSHLTGRNPLQLRVDTDTKPDERTCTAFEALLKRRMTREPLQYLTGSVSFCGLSFQVDPRVLIPRPETALLTEWAVEVLRPFSAPSVLDLCCGSGCIGLTLKHRCPGARVTLSDLSPDALDIAKSNASALHLNAVFFQGDLFSPIHGMFDLIISNPPYIPSEQCPRLQEEVLCEPRMALDGGRDGLDFYRRLALESPVYLKEEGHLMLELGYEEVNEVCDLLSDAGFREIRVRKDLSGTDRMLLARR